MSEDKINYPIPGPLPIKDNESYCDDLHPSVVKLTRILDDLKLDIFQPPVMGQPAQYISISSTKDVLRLQKLLNDNIGKLI